MLDKDEELYPKKRKEAITKESHTKTKFYFPNCYTGNYEHSQD